MADKQLDKETMKEILARMIKNTNDERLAQADMLFGEDWRDMVKMAHMEYFNIPQKSSILSCHS